VNHFFFIPPFCLSVNTDLLSHVPVPNRIFTAKA
jgi:hypothetical protein